MTLVNRGIYLPILTALLLALLMPLSCLGYSVNAFGQETGSSNQAWVFENLGAGWSTENGLAAFGAISRTRRLTLNPLAVTTSRALLVRVIDTSQYAPPSPDPSGITYIPSANMLLMSDGEVNETRLHAGANLFTLTLSGNLVDTSSTTAAAWLNAYSKAPLVAEPTGLAFNPDNGHIFITDDQAGRIFEMMPGRDKTYGTADDIVTSFYRTADFGSYDPEGIAFDSRQQTFYIADGPPGRIIKLAPGPNGFFDAPPPLGDDIVTQIDTRSMGLPDPEGVAVNSDSNRLFVVGHRLDAVLEMTTSGTLVRVFDISFLTPRALSDVAYAPSSMNPTMMSLYITDRGVDNNTEPDENDGRIYEIALPPLIATPASSLIDLPPVTSLRRLYRFVNDYYE